MAGEVNVSVGALENLNASLAQTLPSLDRVVSESESRASQTLQKVDLILDDYIARTNVAYDKYQQAVTDLDYAERNYEDVPDYYYNAVDDTEGEYQRLLDCCHKIESIRHELSQQYNLSQMQMVEFVENYSIMLNKSSAFVVKYIEVLRRSNNALVSETSSNGSSGGVAGGGGKSVQSVQSIAGWLGSVNPNFNNPFTPQFRVNCGSCAFAVDSRLSSNNSNAVASAKNIPTDAAMEQATGKKCVYMSVQDITNHLTSQGAGSHLIVGINRHPTPQGKAQAGHWFNAYFDGNQIHTIDGQSGNVYAWPHDYVDVSAWCALI